MLSTVRARGALPFVSPPASHSAARSEWTVDPQPSVRIAMSADVDFAAVMGVTRWPTGGVVIASDLRNNVQFFSSVDGL